MITSMSYDLSAVRLVQIKFYLIYEYINVWTQSIENKC